MFFRVLRFFVPGLRSEGILMSLGVWAGVVGGRIRCVLRRASGAAQADVAVFAIKLGMVHGVPACAVLGELMPWSRVSCVFQCLKVLSLLQEDLEIGSEVSSLGCVSCLSQRPHAAAFSARQALFLRGVARGPV